MIGKEASIANVADDRSHFFFNTLLALILLSIFNAKMKTPKAKPIVANKHLPRLFILSSVILFSGCAAFSFPYRPDIQQGNIITSEVLARLHPGMTQREVIYLLGSPLLQDPFHSDRWDYYYSLTTVNTPQTQRRVTLYFRDQQLERIVDN